MKGNIPIRPPRRLAPLIKQPEKREVLGVAVKYRCACPVCGSLQFSVLGHFRDNKDRRDRLLLPPLAVTCAKCTWKHVVFDPRTDGYNGQIDSNTCIVVDGPESVWESQKGEKIVHLFISLFYDIDLELEIPNPEEWFGAIAISARIHPQDVEIEVVEFETA